jgi:hypothetical protein
MYLSKRCKIHSFAAKFRVSSLKYSYWRVILKLKADILLLVLLAAIYQGCSVTQPTQLESPEFGFSVLTYFYTQQETKLDTPYVFQIQFGQIYDSLPKIKMNGVFIDTGYSTTSFSSILNFAQTKQIIYEIHFKGSVLCDTIHIPQRIDTVFCNGVLLKDTLVVWIDSSNVYEFKWHAPMESNLFYVTGWSTFSQEINAKSSDTSATIVPTVSYVASDETNTGYVEAQGNIQITSMANEKINASSAPKKRSGCLFVYYDFIYGPWRYVYFNIRRP